MRYRLPVTRRLKTIRAVTPEEIGVTRYAYEVKRSFVNNLPYSVTVIDRNNIANRIPPNRVKPTLDKTFDIDVSITFSMNVEIDIQSVLSQQGINDELNIFKKAIATAQVNSFDNTKTVMVRYSIDDRTLRGSDNSLYLEQLDLTIACNGEELNATHPYSPDGQFLLRSRINMGWGFQILINDPNQEYGNRYININNRVYLVPAVIDMSVRPGVWLYHNGSIDFSEDIVNSDKSEWFDFAEADTAIGLYTTAALARDHGDSQSTFKKDLENKVLISKNEQLNLTHQLKQKEHENEMLSAEQKRLQLEYQQRLAEFEKAQKERDYELSRVKHELEMQKYDREHRNRNMQDYYEERSYKRKDTNEFLKWVPTIIGAGLAIVGIMR